MTHNGKPWNGPDQYEDSSGQLMMLPSDIALIADPDFKKWVEIYAKDEGRFNKDFGKMATNVRDNRITPLHRRPYIHDLFLFIS